MKTGINEHGSPVSTGVDHSHQLYIENLRQRVAVALAQLRGIHLKSLNQAGQYKTHDAVVNAIAELQMCEE